jgi:uncharacterized membrane protein
MILKYQTVCQLERQLLAAQRGERRRVVALSVSIFSLCVCVLGAFAIPTITTVCLFGALGSIAIFVYSLLTLDKYQTRRKHLAWKIRNEKNWR